MELTISPATSTTRRFYLPEADGIRCVAVSLVWFHHYPAGPRAFLSALSVDGWIGVNVFLTLSSFLITSLLMLEYDAKRTISLSRFYSRRVLRIWPLLALALSLNYVLLPAIDYFPGGFANSAFHSDVKYHAIPNLLLLGNWSVAAFGYLSYGFASHLWTINLEEQFYMLWPVAMVYLVARPRQIVSCCIGMIGVSYLARYYFVIVGFNHPAMWVSTITRLDPFAWGAIIAVVYPRLRDFRDDRHRVTSFAITVGVLALSLVCIAALLGNIVWTGNAWWKLGVADIFVMLGVCAVLNSTVLGFVFRLPPLVWLGKISYGLYVYHIFFINNYSGVVMRAVAVYLTGGHANLTAWMLGMLMNAGVLVTASAVSYYFFERSFLKFKQRFETVLSRPA